jgi:hypothetical protein
VDDQGIPAQRVSLVEDGLLTNLLTSRRPSKDRLQSNGHGRGFPGRETAQISNFIVKVDKDGKSYSDLKQELLKLAKDERLDYAIMIKQLSGNQGSIGSRSLRIRFTYPTAAKNWFEAGPWSTHGAVAATHPGCRQRQLHRQSPGWTAGSGNSDKRGCAFRHS